MELEIRELRRDDRDEVEQWLDVALRAIHLTRPDHQSRGLEATLVELASPQAGFEDERLVGLVDGRVVVVGDVFLFSGDESDKALVQVFTDPGHQGHGHGRAMADALETRTGRPVLLAEVDYRHDWATERDGRFAGARGFTAASLATGRELAWPPDVALLDLLEQPTPGYRVQSFVDGLPERYVEPFGVLAGLVGKDAPSGDLEWSGQALTPQEYADDLARDLASGAHRVETLALEVMDDGTPGDPVAFTSVFVPRNPERFLSVGSTYVHRRHRGHGLGMAVKVAVERELLAMDLPHPSLRTGNDDANTWMVSINERLGFVPFIRTAELVLRRA